MTSLPDILVIFDVLHCACSHALLLLLTNPASVLLTAYSLLLSHWLGFLVKVELLLVVLLLGFGDLGELYRWDLETSIVE
jgi:hypothetical protein